VFRQPSNFANGLRAIGQGRLLACEHLTRRVTRTEHDGSSPCWPTRFEGRRLNSPNDIVCARDGSGVVHRPAVRHRRLVGGRAGDASERRTAVYRIDPDSGRLQARDRRPGRRPTAWPSRPTSTVLYVVESRAMPQPLIWAYDVAPDGRAVRQAPVVVDADGAGALRRHGGGRRGHVWCGFGSDGATRRRPRRAGRRARLRPAGRAIAHVHLPERCANLCFGGRHRNRLFMAASHSLYALYVNVQGA
jgi:gluconolactonase